MLDQCNHVQADAYDVQSGIPVHGVDLFRSAGLNVGVCSADRFFLARRRRHTRCGRDWSSDVCSSDLLIFGAVWGGVVLLLFGAVGLAKCFYRVDEEDSSAWYHRLLKHAELIISVLAVIWLLATYWLPLGPGKSTLLNIVFVAVLVGLILGFFTLLERYYRSILRWTLANKLKFLLLPIVLMLFGTTIWLGFNSDFGFVAKGVDQLGWNVRSTRVWSTLAHSLPGIGKEFMPSLDEGSFLLMPTSMPHTGVQYNRKVVGQLDMLLTNIPEVALTVGKVGRVESAQIGRAHV